MRVSQKPGPVCGNGHDREPVKVLVAVRQTCIFETIAHLFSDFSLPLKLTHVSSISILSLKDRPDLILADLFAPQDESSLSTGKVLRTHAGNIPLVALIPADTRDYRDAAVEIGANGLVVLDQMEVDLVSVVEQVLRRSQLVNGVALRIARQARTGAPAGEAAYDRTANDLKKLSGQVIEKLSRQMAPPSRPAPSWPAEAGKAGQQVYLRGLALAANAQNAFASERVVRTACNLNCGSHFCGLKVTVRSGQLVKIEPADFPDERYRRVCLKGISHVQMAAHSERLLHPLKRSGERGQGQWQQVSWEQALGDISAQMKSLAERFGPESLMFMLGSGQLGVLNSMVGVYTRLASLLGASAVDLNAFGLDSAVPSGLEDSLGKGAGYLGNDFADLPNSRLVLIWGGDPAQSMMNWWRFFLEAQRGGTKLVAIDSSYTITASKCAVWLPVRPGSDLYLALAMLNTIVGRGWMDRKFVVQHTAAPLLVRLDDGRYLRSPTGSNEYLAWDACLQKPVPAGQTENPALEGQYTIGGITCRPAFALLQKMLQPYTVELAAQKTGLPAGQIAALAEEYATTRPARIYSLYGIDRWHFGATFGRLIATLAAFTGNLGIPGGDASVSGISEGVFLDSRFYRPGGRQHRPVNPLQLPDQILSGKPYPIKAVWVAYSNWLNQWPDLNRLKGEVLPRLSLFVVADQFLTETARYADYVLPVANLFERPDIVKGPGPYLQYQPAILTPPGECRPDFDIAAALAGQFGCGAYFSRSPNEYLAEALGDEPTTRELSFDALLQQGVLHRNVPPEPQVANATKAFKTASGRVEFYVERLIPAGRALPDCEAPLEARPDGALAERFPLVCVTKTSRYRIHSTFVNASWLREIEPAPLAWIHPSVAASRGIQNNDLVRVFNLRGFAILRTRLSESIPPGAIYLNTGWQSGDFYAGHNQSLTHGSGNLTNALGPNSSFFDVLVDVARDPSSKE